MFSSHQWVQGDGGRQTMKGVWLGCLGAIRGRGSGADPPTGLSYRILPERLGGRAECREDVRW
ncbi:hypothetical protein AKJ16_DCAP24305 [Drosera capensis]